MRRLGTAVTTVLALAAGGLAGALPAQATAQSTVQATAQAKALVGARAPHRYVADAATKVDVLGEWAHPDDDTSIIGPCGVWHQRFGTRCGVIQITRGEGGGNATGSETGTALGLRRENEDRVAHFRSGTADLFYVDRVDFFYNQSAPLTNRIWDHEETLRRVTRIVRTTQPEVFIGWTPTLAAGHGNHQESGRLIWEAVQAAADPSRFPGQLRGAHALSTWQVKKVYSGGSTEGTGATPSRASCLTGFVPALANPDTVAGVWTGYKSPYRWPAGNVQGRTPGARKSWQQVADEGASAYPTQSRVMYMGKSKPACSTFALTYADVPFQPNTLTGKVNPLAGSDGAVLDGAQRQDPGGLPLGTTEHLSLSHFYDAPGVPFTATLRVRSPRALPAASVTLRAPTGWEVGAPQRLGRIPANRTVKVGFRVTPPAGVRTGVPAKVRALLRSGSMTGYTDNVVWPVPAVEGRFRRWGKWAEYDRWVATTPAARRLGRSPAVTSVGLGGSVKVPVDVHNWSRETERGTVSIALPAGFTADATSRGYGPLAPGATTTVRFTVRSTAGSLPSNPQLAIPVTTTSRTSSSSEQLALSVVPTTTVAEATTDPVVDGTAGASEYPGPRLDIGRVWQGPDYCTGPADCGTSAGGATDHSWAKVSWRNDALYLFAHVRDDSQSYAVKPEECVSHWLADSVEFLIDPRGNASRDALDTANTFKLGVFPFTDDPRATNGNGANGPCWERDADNHQGFATGPLSRTVAEAPNAPGVQVASTARWVGDNRTTTDHAYAGGGYDVEVKVPMADLPAAVDPAHLGLNITPYDNDDTAAPGSTTLRHIDNSTRLGWSAFGSVQSDPFNWGLATVPGYTPPAGRSTTSAAPVVGHPNLDGTDSPQTIRQSARNGVPIAGRVPAPPGDRVTALSRPAVRSGKLRLSVTANGPGTARVFVTGGATGAIPVWRTSCTKQADPPPDFAMTACARSDGGTPRWSPDLSGHLLGAATVKVHAGRQRVSIPLTSAQARRFAVGGSALVSFVGSTGGVQALRATPVRTP